MIYKNNAGDLWCDCGNTEFPMEICPLDYASQLAHVDDLTGNERMYQCLHCGAITDVRLTPVREKPKLVALKGEQRAQLQVRQSGRGRTCYCRHLVHAGSRFVLAGIGDGSAQTYCADCVQKLLKAILRSETSELWS